MTVSLHQYDPRIATTVRDIILKHALSARIYPFGSRVTGEARTESDYDFAFGAPDASDETPQAIRSEIDQIHTLYRIVVAEREKWIAEGNGDIVADLAAKHFEFVYEMSWKVLKRMLDYLGIDARAPLTVFKEAYAQGMLDDEQVWLDMIEMCDLSSHVYDEHEISRILAELDKLRAREMNVSAAPFYRL